MKELEHYQSLFHLNKDNPPTYKNHPPVAGAIAWARDLYLRAKKPILRFQVPPTALPIVVADSSRESVYIHSPVESPMAAALTPADAATCPSPLFTTQAHEGLLSSDYGVECKQRYLSFARSVDAYMTKLYQDWEGRVQNTGEGGAVVTRGRRWRKGL